MNDHDDGDPCECGHSTRDHNCWWDDDNGRSGMGCDLCDCNDMTPPWRDDDAVGPWEGDMKDPKRILDLEIEVEARQCAADDAVALLRYWKSMMHPAAWICWTPETCGEARVDGEAGSCPTCLVDAFLAVGPWEAM